MEKQINIVVEVSGAPDFKRKLYLNGKKVNSVKIEGEITDVIVKDSSSIWLTIKGE